MNSTNKLVVWKPLEDVTPPMFIEAIHDDYEGFRILLKGEGLDAKTLRIRFENRVFYRNTDAGYMYGYWASLLPADVKQVFYIIENSTLVKEFLSATEGLHPNWDIEHYAIYTEQDCLDVLSYCPPTADWLN